MELGRGVVFRNIYSDKASDKAVNIKADKGYVSTYVTDVCKQKSAKNKDMFISRQGDGS